MPKVIPLRSDLPYFDIQVSLEDITYTLVFRFNTRERSWYMDIHSEAGEFIALSIKVVIDAPLAKRSQNPLLPPGVFIAEDTSSARMDPSYDPVIQRGDLGDRVLLLYFESTELPV